MTQVRQPLQDSQRKAYREPYQCLQKATAIRKQVSFRGEISEGLGRGDENREICKDTWLLVKHCCQQECCFNLSKLSKALIGTGSVLIFILVVTIYVFKRCTRPRILPQTGGQPSVNVVTVNSNMNTNNNAASSTMMPVPMAYQPQPMYQYPTMPGPYPNTVYASSTPATMQSPALYAQVPPPAYQDIGTHSSPTSVPVTQAKQTPESQGVKVLPTA